MPVPILLMARALDLGGSERQLAEIARSLDPAEFTPHVACLQEGGFRDRDLRDRKIPILPLGVSSFIGPSALAGAVRLARYLREHSIQLVHTFDVPMNLFGAPLARMFRTPRVVSSQRAHRALTPGLRRSFLRLTDQMVDAIVVNSQAVRSDLIKNDRVSPARIHLCYNGIDMDLFRRVRNRREHPVVIGSIGALRPEKNFKTLLDAFARLDAQLDAKLVIVGDGPSKTALLSHAAKLGLEERFVLEPATKDVAARLASIDIFVLPSLTESCSNSLIEAMACECCVIASNAGGNSEVVTDLETGLLFEPDSDALLQCLNRLLHCHDLRRRLAQSAAESVRERFTIARAIRQMSAIYRQVLASPPANADDRSAK